MNGLPTILTIGIAALYALSGIALAFSTKLNPHSVALGVRVPEKFSTHPIILQATRRFTTETLFITALITAGILSIGFLTQENNDTLFLFAILFTPFIQIAGFSFSFQRNRKTIQQAKEEEKWYEEVEVGIQGTVASESIINELKQHTLSREHLRTLDLPAPRIPWPIYVISFCSIVAIFLYLALRWNDIPNPVPTHFNARGEADAWSDKSIGSVFTFPCIVLGIWAMAPLTSAFINAEAKHTRAPSLKAQLRARSHALITSNSIAWYMSGIAIFTGILSAITPFPEFAKHLGTALAIFFIEIVLATVALLVYVMKANKKLNAALQSIPPSPQDKDVPDDEEHIKFGIFYSNKNDPRVMVPKRFGSGLDFNYAHWQGKAFLVGILLSLLIPLGLVIFL